MAASHNGPLVSELVLNGLKDGPRSLRNERRRCVIEHSGSSGGGAALRSAPDALLAAARSGDEVAVERLLAPHVPALYALCRGMLTHAEDAEDAVGDTLLRALNGLPQFRGTAHIKTWLTRIAVNVCLERKRGAARHQPPDAATPLDALAHPGASSLESATVARVYLAQALESLRPRQRAVLLLKELEGWTAAEIAEATGWSTPRVKVELYRTRRALAAWIKRHEELKP
jgi:RNA polymerase sigma-70 factor (ECF subfamily)